MFARGEGGGGEGGMLKFRVDLRITELLHAWHLANVFIELYDLKLTCVKNFYHNKHLPNTISYHKRAVGVLFILNLFF